MANVSILNGNVTIYFSGDISGDKQILWTGTVGSFTPAYHSMNELYSAIQDVFDNDTASVGDYMNVGVPIKALTNDSYRIGVIESNDPEPWFIDRDTVKYLGGGSLKTQGWDRVVGTRRGIVRVKVQSNNFTTADIGDTVTHPDGDSGKILYVDNVYGAGATSAQYIWIRPDSFDATDNFDSTTGNITASTSGSTGIVATSWESPILQNNKTLSTYVPGQTGNEFWTNFQTVGTIESGSQITMFQWPVNVSDTQTSLQWAINGGHIDELILMTDQSDDTYINDGYVTLSFREKFTLYDTFVTQVTGEGTNILPLSNSPDLNNPGPAEPANGISVEFAGPYTADIDPDIGSPNENYSIKIDVNNKPLANVYAHLQDLFSEQPSTSLPGGRVIGGINPYGVKQREFRGLDHQIDYATEEGTVSIGDRVVDNVTGASAHVFNKQGTYVMLGQSFGDFQAGANLEGPSGNLTNISNIDKFQASKQAPMATFAGGRLFCSRGVYLANVLVSESNSYETIDDDGNVIEEQIQVTYSITNVIANTEIRLFTTDLTTELGGHNDIGGSNDPNQDANVTYSGPDGNGRYTASYQYVYSSDTDIIVIGIATGYLPVRVEDTLTNADKSLQIDQITDRQYIP